MKRLKILFVLVLIFLLVLPIVDDLGLVKTDAATFSAPSNFKAEVFQYYNQLSWTNTESSLHYYTVIEKSIDNGQYNPIKTLPKGKTTYRDQSVSNGHVYTYRAKIYYGSSSSSYTHEVEAITLYPEYFDITRIFPGQVDLEWTYPALPLNKTPEYETLIERRPSKKSTWTLIATLKSTETTYRDTEVNDDTFYDYRIRTRYNNGNFSNYYPSTQGMTAYTRYHPDTHFWGYAVSDTKIKLEWDMSMAQGGTVFIYKEDSDGTLEEILASKNAVSFVDSGLTKGKTYTYWLGMKSKSGFFSDGMLKLEITCEYVPGPTDFNVSTVSSDRILVSWSYPHEVETGFEVWRKASGETWEILETLPKNSETFTDASALTGKEYNYIVRAKRGDTSFSSFTRSVSVLNEYPPTPEPLVYIASQGLLSLYSAEQVPANTVLTLEYREEINIAWKDLKTADKGTLIAHVGYSGSTELYFRLRADRGGLVSYGPEFHFFGTAPQPAQNAAAPLVGYQRVFLSWDDVSLKEEGYNIYRTVNGKTELIGRVDRDCESFEDKSPARGSVSRYDIKAFNVIGESAASSITINIANITAYSDITLSHWAHDAVYNLQGLGALDNSSAGYFYPENTVSRGQAVRMILKSFNIPSQQQGLFSFTDLFQSHTYYKDLKTAVSLGIVFPDAQYRIYPDKAITRGELLLLLSNALNYLDRPLNYYDSENLNGFSDFYQIPEEEMHIVASFFGDGIISGKSGNRLGLPDYASRAECAVIIYRTLKRYGVGL